MSHPVVPDGVVLHADMTPLLHSYLLPAAPCRTSASTTLMAMQMRCVAVVLLAQVVQATVALVAWPPRQLPLLLLLLLVEVPLQQQCHDGAADWV